MQKRPPAEFDVIIDTNRDSEPDFVVFNAELGGFGVTGQNVVFVGNLATEQATAVAFTDADLQSGSVILTVPTLALGITDAFNGASPYSSCSGRRGSIAVADRLAVDASARRAPGGDDPAYRVTQRMR